MDTLNVSVTCTCTLVHTLAQTFLKTSSVIPSIIGSRLYSAKALPRLYPNHPMLVITDGYWCCDTTVYDNFLTLFMGHIWYWALSLIVSILYWDQPLALKYLLWFTRLCDDWQVGCNDFWLLSILYCSVSNGVLSNYLSSVKNASLLLFLQQIHPMRDLLPSSMLMWPQWQKGPNTIPCNFLFDCAIRK